MTWFPTVAAALSGVVAIAACVAATVHLRVSILTVALGLATLGVATLAVLGVGLRHGLDLFGITRVLYLQATIAVPVLGAGLLVVSRRRTASPLAVLLGAALLVPAPVGLWSTHVAPFRLDVDQHSVPVPAARGGESTVRVGVLADLQTTGVGDHERRGVQELLDAEPDVILLPGDLFQADASALTTHGPAVRELLERLRAPGGVYLVEGDVDSAERLAALVPPNITRLDDRVVEAQVRDRRVRIGGTRLEVGSTAAERVRDDLRSAGGAITVLVSHRPDTVLRLPPVAGIDLVVAGHTHGGQISVPGFGPPVTLSGVPRSVGAGGLHQVAGNPIYVSTGVGMERGQAPQVRFGVAPSVAVLDLG